MAFDFGTRSIGVAIGQRLTCTARPLVACKVYNSVPDWQQITRLINEWQPIIVVIGLPLNMDGSKQPLTALAIQFAKQLSSRFSNIQVLFHDERCSTVEARAILFARGSYRSLEKGKVDSLAAAIILESWLEFSP